MNNKLLFTSMILAGSLFATAQKSRPTFAITGDGNYDFVWMNIRQLDISTGKVTKTLFERSKTKFSITDIQSKAKTDESAFSDAQVFSSAKYPTGTFVAAAAYDERTNKLFFTPMKKGELRWLDLNIKNEHPEFYTLQPEAMKVVNPADEATSITRMVIASDGNGYALSNDASHFFTFTTGKKPSVVSLGNVIDADKNAVSIHNKCTSWGGDMIADAFGKLYVISANHHIFVIDVNTRIATYKGMIEQLPGDYTTNAAAVNEDGDIVVASANKFEGFYKFNINDLKAIKLAGSDEKYNASDFANGNLLLQKEANALSGNLTTKNIPALPENVTDSKVFPNPVTNGSFNVLFENKPEGKYTIVLSDLAGRTFSTRTVSVTKGTQVEKVNIRSTGAKGVYVVRVLDANKSTVINEKIIVQ